MLSLAMTQEPVEHASERASAPPARPGALDAAAAGGDRDALAALLRQHGRAIQQLCHYVSGRDDAADATQEAFERIVVGIGRFDPSKGTFRTWALAVARNVCRDRLRRRGLERATFLADGETQTERAAARRGDPERAAVVRDHAEVLERSLSTLPEGMRSAVVLFHLHEASYEEIAEALDVPIGTVMTWLHRGRKRLRTALESAEVS
jgi:RNA polymerase sigma-70 factor (ECF subfamily)